jgi:antiphage defense system Thoeris ThsB-like protein
MRDAVVNSSAVCVLVGTNTWQGRWVKYEIARAIIDERGLLAVHINGIKHHQRQAPDLRGYNPLFFMGIYHSPDGRYYIYEYKNVTISLLGLPDWQWRPYEDFKSPVNLSQYIPAINQGGVVSLATYTFEYDYDVHDGATNIGTWIDQAAKAVGR